MGVRLKGALVEPDLFGASPSGDVLSVTELTGKIKRL